MDQTKQRGFVLRAAGSKWAKVGLALVILNEIRGVVVVATVLLAAYR